MSEKWDTLTIALNPAVDCKLTKAKDEVILKWSIMKFIVNDDFSICIFFQFTNCIFVQFSNSKILKYFEGSDNIIYSPFLLRSLRLIFNLLNRKLFALE